MGFPPPTVNPLLLLILLFLLHNGLVPAIDDLISDHQQKFRVHFFRGPDGQWLSLLNLRVVFQTPDIVDVEEESVEESLDFDDDDDWTVVTLDPIIRPQRNWTQQGTGKFGDDGFQKLAENEKKKEQQKQEASLEEAITLESKSQGEGEQEMTNEKVENGSVEQENEEELIPTGPVPELSLLQDILPWIPHLLRRHHKVHKTPSKTRTSPQQQRRLHLEDILGRSSNATVSPAQMENATETVIGSSSVGEDGQPVEETTQLPSTSTIPEEMTTESPPPLEPINEEELALNLHKDSLHRNESVLRQMFTNVSTSKMGIDEKARRDHSSETFRDLGGSFILPLLKELKYDNKSIPLVFPDESLKVTVSLEILHLGNFDNFQMEYELDVLFHLQWFDVRLANNFTKSVRIKEQQIIDKIWKPDTLFFNSKYSYFHLVSFPNFLMRIQPNGHITYTSRVTLLPDCQMNFCNFPHDTQRCDLLISSIAHPQSMLEYSWDREQPIVFGRKISLPDLHIQKIATDHCEIKSKLIPSSCLTLQFELERDSARYIAEKYLPSTLAMIFSWVAPYVPYNYEEVRIITPITVLLTLVQMEKGNQEVMTSYLTSLDIWFVVIKGFTVLSLVESLTVMAYIKRGRAIEKQAQRAVNEYQKEMLQMEAKHIVRVYHRLDHWSRVCFPVAFLCFLIFYLGFIVQRDEQSCREQLIDLSTLESII